MLAGLDGVLNLQASLAKFARTCYPDKLECAPPAAQTIASWSLQRALLNAIGQTRVTLSLR